MSEEDDVISDWPGQDAPTQSGRRRKPAKKNGMGIAGFAWIVITIALIGVGVYGVRKGLKPQTATASTPAAPVPQLNTPPTMPMAVLAPTSQPVTVADTRPVEIPRAFTATQLVGDYGIAEALSDATLKGHLLQITGNASEIENGAFGGMYVTLRGDYKEVHGVRCFIRDEKETASVRMGDKVTVIGTCEGVVQGLIHVDQAHRSIQSAKAQ